MMEKARAAGDLHGKLSPIQKRKIHDDLMADIGRAAKSDVFRAMQYDVRLFGEDAFTED